MISARYKQLEARIPATSGAGITLFTAALLLPVMMIALALRVVG